MVRLRETEATDELTARHLRKVAFLERLGSELPNRIHRQRSLHRSERSKTRVTALELFHREPICHSGQAGTSVSVEARSQETKLAELSRQMPGERSFAEVLGHD